MSPFAADSEPQFPWLNPQSYSKEVRPDLKSPWLRVESENEPPDWRFASGGSIAPAPTGSSNAFGLDWRSHNFGLAAPFGDRQFTLPDSPPSEPSLEPPPWLSRMPGHDAGPDGHLASIWPWLRAEPEDAVPGFHLNPDGSSRQSDPASHVKLRAGAYDPPGQVVEKNFSAAGTWPAVHRPWTPLDRLRQPTGVGGLSAGSLAVPMAEGMARSQAARIALSELATFAGRAAPAVAGAVGAASAALPLLVIPTNRQSETVDLADGLRARLRPGQRSVEIERRADNGLFGTGIGARWETLPVDAELSAQDDGSARVLIDQGQLERAVGPEAAGRAWDAIGSAMARPPKKRKEDAQPPSNTVNKPGQAPDPGNGRGPPRVPNVTTAAELAARILEQTNRLRAEAETEAEIVQAYRHVRRDRGDQIPDRHYRGEHGFETAVGVRMPSALPDPTPGREFSPDDPNHRKGYIGELELANLVHAEGSHFVVHYGNAPGVQGPDVLSIGPDGLFIVWDSKARSASRSVGPSMAASSTLNPAQVEEYVLREIRSGRLPSELGYRALKQLENGNYNICTVGTANAHDGFVEFVRKHIPRGPRRQ